MALDPTPPDLPHEEAKREYRRIAERLSSLEPIHRAYVQMYAMTYAILLQAVDEIREHGPILIREDGTPYENPAVEIAVGMLNDLRESIAGMGAEQEPPSGMDTFDLKRNPPEN